MSDPVTNAEIEDVLSSIRRLVSDDARTLVRTRPVTQPAQPDRLVLTPALRVAEPPEDFVVDADSAEVPVEMDGQPEAPETWETESEGVREAGWSDEQVDVPDEDLASDEHELADGLADPGEAAEPWTNPEATLYEAAAAAREVEDGEDQDEALGDPGEVMAEPAQDNPLEEYEPAPFHEDVPVIETPPEVLVLEPAPNHASAVEVVGAAIDDTAQDWEPDGGDAEAIELPETQHLEWQDTADNDKAEADFGVTDLEVAPDEGADDGETALFSAEETIMDEATLRELVTDIVREELQGALGERITRNVRKLVRREINRALSVQDLE